MCWAHLVLSYPRTEIRFLSKELCVGCIFKNWSWIVVLVICISHFWLVNQSPVNLVNMKGFSSI